MHLRCCVVFIHVISVLAVIMITSPVVSSANLKNKNGKNVVKTSFNNVSDVLDIIEKRYERIDSSTVIKLFSPFCCTEGEWLSVDKSSHSINSINFQLIYRSGVAGGDDRSLYLTASIGDSLIDFIEVGGIHADCGFANYTFGTVYTLTKAVLTERSEERDCNKNTIKKITKVTYGVFFDFEKRKFVKKSML